MKRTSHEALAAACLAGLVLAVFGPIWLRGLTPYWGDMTYIHHPWQALGAQLLEKGRLPLWDPYIYFGMPMAAKMQSAAFYPGQIPFFLFGFATAASFFHGIHYALAGWLAFLWLRSLRLSRGAALGGAAVFACGGGMAGHMPFLNHLSVLSLTPGLFLFFREPALLALTLALAFLAGYPPFLAGSAILAWAVMCILAAPRQSWSRWLISSGRGWAAAAVLSAALTACQLWPGGELMAMSRRAGGMALEETLRFGYSWRDLVQWVSPVLAYWKRFDPAVDWHQCSTLGFVGSAAAAWGLWSLGRRRAVGLAALGAAVLLLILGDTNPVSRALWEHLPPLRFVRYPGNVSFLGWLPAALLAAAGLSRCGPAVRTAAFFLLAAELVCYARAAPAAPRGLFTEAGPLVRSLQEGGRKARYLLSPLALESHSGSGVRDWKWRLYGMTNAPFRLRAAGNFGEPLVPRSNYELMDFLYRQGSAAAAARLMPWLGADTLLTRDPTAPSKLLRYEGKVLWHVYRLAAPVSSAWALTEQAGDLLPAGLPDGPLPALGKALPLNWPREDRYEVEGSGAGWAFVAEPRYPGWSAVLETARGRSLAKPLPALAAFQKVRVPPGPWRLHFFYAPASWLRGVGLSALVLLGFGVYWYNRSLRLFGAQWTSRTWTNEA
ncbi:MAG TPA: hypothetical protein DEB40_09230 [Elusimicrobia bacterium]|nr:hypothetical protein [Elusimicrobiota bacterium]HBT61911.1 hypothetical protein [Elusimicrobiota bacterium]